MILLISYIRSRAAKWQIIAFYETAISAEHVFCCRLLVVILSKFMVIIFYCKINIDLILHICFISSKKETVYYGEKNFTQYQRGGTIFKH